MGISEGGMFPVEAAADAKALRQEESIWFLGSKRQWELNHVRPCDSKVYGFYFEENGSRWRVLSRGDRD